MRDFDWMEFGTFEQFINADGALNEAAVRHAYTNFLRQVPDAVNLQLLCDVIAETKLMQAPYPFGNGLCYNAEANAIYYDIAHPKFKEEPIIEVLTHELAHAIDYKYVHSCDIQTFNDAIAYSSTLINPDADLTVLSLVCGTFDRTRALFDIFGAVTDGNSPQFMQSPYGHHWTNSSKAVETFAQIFTLEVLQENTALDVLTILLPDLYQAYCKLEPKEYDQPPQAWRGKD